MFTNYVKETGPWRNASIGDDGTDVITVVFDATLLAIEILVS
jgi:hypothetical protein